MAVITISADVNYAAPSTSLYTYFIERITPKMVIAFIELILVINVTAVHS